MKIYRHWLTLAVLVLIGLIGSYFYKLYLPSLPLQSSQSLVKWQKIEASRQHEAKKIYKKATLIVTKLGEETYSHHGLRIENWGVLFGDTGIDIYYNSICVFSVIDGFWGGVGEVKVFHPGKWIEILQSIDIDKELTRKKIDALKAKYQSF